MFTKRNALLSGILFLVLIVAACGAPAPSTQAPSYDPPSEYEYYDEPAATESAATEAPADGYFPEASEPNSNPPHRESNGEPDDMFFRDYGVNPSVETEDDNLSTFALDVDTGSYTV